MPVSDSPSRLVGLGDLPPELLLLIFSNVRPKHLMTAVRKVCRLFYRLISNEKWWLCRIQHSHLDIRLPAAEIEDERFTPSRSYDAMLVEGDRWNNWVYENRSVAEGARSHYATVDGVRLFKGSDGRRFCLTGGRDRAIKLWDLDSVQSTSDKSHWLSLDKDKAHTGWIWAFDFPSDDTVLSCSWDGSIKMWQLGDGRMEQLSSAMIGSGAATAVLSYRSAAICSTFRSKVCLMDLNDNMKVVSSHMHHKGPVFSIAQNGNLIYSYGEDRKVICVDKRKLSEAVTWTKLDHYATNMSLATGLIHCATNKGTILALRADNLRPSHQFDVVVGEPVRQVIKTYGSVMALTKQSGLKVYSLGVQPRELACSGKFDCEPCRFDYLDGDLAVGCGDGSVIFWHRSIGFDL